MLLPVHFQVLATRAYELTLHFPPYIYIYNLHQIFPQSAQLSLITLYTLKYCGISYTRNELIVDLG